jgi:hypothetical protein
VFTSHDLTTRFGRCQTLSAGPGAGKSFLVKQFEKQMDGCQFIESNVAQWTGFEDLATLCEQIRTTQLNKVFPIVFIDEVDTQILGEHIYGKLLAPVWDAVYFRHGIKRTLGPAIYFVAGSSEKWKEPNKLLKADGADKLKDLVSRFSMHPIQMPSLASCCGQEDAKYIVASLLKKRFPFIEKIEKGVLKFFDGHDLKHGPRSIAQVIELIGDLKDPKIVTVEDLKKINSDDLRVHSSSQRVPDDKKPIKILD